MQVLSGIHECGRLEPAVQLGMRCPNGLLRGGIRSEFDQVLGGIDGRWVEKMNFRRYN